MISRVADHCFWLGRYLERAESTARVLFVTRNLAGDGELTPEQCWHPAIIVWGEEAAFIERYGASATSDAERVQETLVWDEEDPSSLVQSVGAARDNARSIREVVSLEVWEATNALYLWLHSAAARDLWQTARMDFYRHVREQTQLVLGLSRSTMLHDEPLDFLWLGVLLERCGQTARILDVHHHALSLRERTHQVIETGLWLSLLRACSGFEPFMKRNQGRVTGAAVAAFLVLEPHFPRSVHFAVHSAHERLDAIRREAVPDGPGAQTAARLKALDRWICELTPGQLAELGVHAALTHVVDETAGICAGIGADLLGFGPAASATAGESPA